MNWPQDFATMPGVLVYTQHPGSTIGRSRNLRYMRIVAYTAVQGVYAFVCIGVLRTIFDITATRLHKCP